MLLLPRPAELIEQPASEALATAHPRRCAEYQPVPRRTHTHTKTDGRP